MKVTKETIKEELHRRLDQALENIGELESTIIIAALAHLGQKDKGGATYLRHPLRVMESTFLDEDVKRLAVMHDVAEDTFLDLEKLRILGFSEEDLLIIDLLTKKKGQAYQEKIDEIAENPKAKIIKWRDVKDNLKLSRIKNADNLGPKDLERLKNYIVAEKKLRPTRI